MSDLDIIREEIDNIDRELVKLIEKRMEKVLKVADYKEKNNMKIFDKSREDEVVKKNITYIKNENFKEVISELFTCIMDISKQIQSKEILSKTGDKKEKKNNLDNKTDKEEIHFKKNKIGFQGVSGSFSEQALIEYFGECDNLYNYTSFEEVFMALENNEIDCGVLPIENSSTGGVLEVYDLLRKYGFYIVGERCIKVDHNLLAIKGTTMEDIREVYSHPQALQQSSEFFANYKNLTLIPYKNTAISAKLTKDKNSKNIGAVASKKAAELYDLDIIKANINHNKNNYTRFIVIGKQLEINDDCDKISLVFTVPHKPGMLYSALSNFANNNLNMMKIESRPIVGKSWEYFFYIDFQGNLNKSFVKEAIKEIEENSSYFKLLGNYKSHKNAI